MERALMSLNARDKSRVRLRVVSVGAVREPPLHSYPACAWGIVRVSI